MSKQMRVADEARVSQGELVVEHLTVSDRDVVREAERFAERSGEENVAEFAGMAVVIGAKAMKLAGTTVDVEEIKRSVAEFSAQVTSVAELSVEELRKAVEQATSPEDGTVMKGVKAVLRDLAEEISELVEGEDGPVRTAIGKTVKDITDRALGEMQRTLQTQNQLVREVIDSDNPGSPLHSMRVELLRQQGEVKSLVQKELAELKGLIEVSQAVSRTMERTAVKGLSYEDSVVVVMDRLAAGAGDVLEATGRKPGLLGGSKKGDAVITLGQAVGRKATVRLVVETKDATLSPEAWRAELDQARKNRGAVGAIAVVKGTEHMPGGDRLRVIDNMSFLVAFDPEEDDSDLLLAAYQLLRTQAACAALEGDGDVDIAATRAQIENAVVLLDQFDKISRAAASAKNNVDSVRSGAESLRDQLLACLGRALRALNGPDASTGSGNAVTCDEAEAGVVSAA